MQNNYLKMFFMACCILLASQVDAQFRFSTKPSVGQTTDINTETGIATFLINFNTDKPNSTWTQDTSGITISFQKCQTDRGFQSEVFTADTVGAPTVLNDDFRIRRWNSNENPVHMASIDSLTAILAKWSEKYAGTADTAKNIIWKPSGCLFDVDGDDTNQAFGTHPGQYKKVEFGFQFSFSGTAVTSDITFEMDTYDLGNTGLSASYTLQVALGSESNIVASIDSFYVTGQPKKTVNLAEAIGMTPSDFSNTKVYFKLKTLGTGAAIAMDSFDPTVVFDNMTVSYQLPSWIDPPAGAAANSIFDNMTTPLVALLGEATPDSLHLQTLSRYGSLTITNDLQNPSVQNIVFPDTLGLKAKDANGNYTIEVPYTITPGVFDSGTQTWSKAKITVAAPAGGGAVNDDMMFYFTAAPSSTNLHFARLELNSGTRIWFDYYMKGIDADKHLLYVSARGPDQLILSDSVSIAQLENAGYSVTLVDDNDVKDGGYDYSPYKAVVFGESCSSSNVVAFGNTDHYPIPCLMMEPLSVRTDKWGWVVNPDPGTFGNSDYPGFKQDNNCLPGTTEFKIINNTHYITQDYTQDTVVAWSSAVCGTPEVVFAFGFNLNQDMSGAYPLVKNNSEGITDANLWAVPAGTTVTGGTVTEHRTVILGIHELGLYGKDADMTEYATEDFYRLMLRSVEWILGAGDDAPLVGTKEPVISRNISAYPNPATGQVTLSFDLQGLEQGSLSLTNMMGQRFDIFRNRQLFQGNNQVDVDLSGFAAGMYMYQLEANGKIFVGKLVITK